MNDEYTHYCDPQAGDASPCGNVDDEALVSPHFEDVDCPMCLHAISNDRSVPKPTFH